MDYIHGIVQYTLEIVSHRKFQALHGAMKYLFLPEAKVAYSLQADQPFRYHKSFIKGGEYD